MCKYKNTLVRKLETFLCLWHNLHHYNAQFYVPLSLKQRYYPFFLSWDSMLNVCYLSLPSCKQAQIFFYYYYKAYLIVREVWMRSVVDIMIIRERLQGHEISLGILTVRNFSVSISSDLQVTVVSWFAGWHFPFGSMLVRVVQDITNFRLTCRNMACTGLSCTGR